MAIIAEVSWDDVAAGNFPQVENLARKAFRQAVEDVAQQAREALPDSHGRIDAAVKMVIAGDVELLDDGTAKVASQSNGTTAYFVVNSACECKDYPKAPGNFCKHRLAYGIAKRATALAKQRLEAQLDGTHNGQATVPSVEAPTPTTPIVSPLPEASASCNCYVDVAGRKVQFTLRDVDEARLLLRLEALLARFPAEEEAESTASTTSPEGWCAVHHVQMKRHTNAKGSWWSHKTTDGSWCHGK